MPVIRQFLKKLNYGKVLFMAIMLQFTFQILYKIQSVQCEPCLPGTECPPCISDFQVKLVMLSMMLWMLVLLYSGIALHAWLERKKPAAATG